MKPVLTFRGVDKSFGSRTIIRELNLEIYPGDIVEVSGPSGIGKTTLLNLAGGVEHPTRGEVEERLAEVGPFRKHHEKADKPRVESVWKGT